MIIGAVIHTSTGTAIHLHDLADLGAFVSGVMSIFVLLSLWFLWYQVRLQARDSRRQLVTGFTSLINEVGHVFIEYADMRKFFHDGVGPEKEEDRQRAQAIAVTLANAMDHIAANLDRVEHEATWREYFKGVYDKSPVLRDYLDAHKTWYGPKLLKALEIS
jgi:hypothetical protein